MSYETPAFRMPTLTTAIKHLMLVNAAVFVLNMIVVGRLSEPKFAEALDSSGDLVYRSGAWFALQWGALWDGYGLGLYRLITFQFTHDWSSPMHLLGNMLGLYFFGTLAESRLGYLGTWKLYLASSLAGALLQTVLMALLGRIDTFAVGASGSCFGFIIYAAFMAPRSWVILMVFPVRLWVVAVVSVFLGIYATYVEFVAGVADGVAHGGHLGGAALGYAAFRYSWFIDWADHAGRERPNFFKGLLQGMQKKRAESQQRQSNAQQLQLDEILAKVKSEGLGALSPAERRFLEQMSKRAKKGQ